jgi:hypothetical protein
MKIPQALYAALLSADEDYLIALCNKGTVNRAKKDLSAIQPEVKQIEGETITLSVGDTVCTITSPLGSSTCTCPSSTMCRHRISAILWLKEQASLEDTSTEEAAAPSENEPAGEMSEELTALLSDYPTQTLIRQLGERRVSSLIQRENSGEEISIQEGSTVTVELPWIPATVRFISPLEHSRCTCHSQSFCTHKAEALLTWQLRHGIVTADSLLATFHSDTGNILDRREICIAIQNTLMDWMRTGLTRLPASCQETTERLVGLCHTSALPSLERAMRRLHGELQSYFARSAAFRSEMLLHRMSVVWRLASALQTVSEQEALQLAGTFRDEYQAVGNLQLYLLGLREVDLAGGYAGTVYYFWETQKHRYYAYRDLRPKFYEGKRTPGPIETVLWELPGTLRQAWNCRLDLSGARVSGEGNLSATNQCRGTLLQKCPPGSVIPSSAVAEDFSSLLPRSHPRLNELDRLVILRPHRGELQEYDRVEQRFTLRLLDFAGRDIWLTVRYREEEQAVVEALEQLASQWSQNPDLQPAFFGVLYREDGRLCLYPIECFTNWEGTS